MYANTVYTANIRRILGTGKTARAEGRKNLAESSLEAFEAGKEEAKKRKGSKRVEFYGVHARQNRSSFAD